MLGLMKPLLLLFVLLGGSAFAQNATRNVLVVTLDGLRWQEVFRGADEMLNALVIAVASRRRRRRAGEPDQGDAGNLARADGRGAPPEADAILLGRDCEARADLRQSRPRRTDAGGERRVVFLSGLQ